MKFKNNVYIILLFLILILVVITFLVGRFFNSNLGIFPFDSNVWGTFSDYLTIILTIVSLYVIYKTLLVQIESIKDQSKSIQAQTEELKFAKLDRRKDFQVDFEITRNLHSYGEGDLISFKYLNEPNLTVEVKFHTNPIVYDKLMRKKILASNSFFNQAKYRISKNQSIDIFLIDKIHDQFTVSLYFMDFYGFKYSKTYMFFSNGKNSSTLLRYIE